MKARNTQTSKLQPKNWQDRACRIELADLGLSFNHAKSVLPLACECRSSGRALRAKGLRRRRLRTPAPRATYSDVTDVTRNSFVNYEPRHRAPSVLRRARSGS